MPQLLLPELYFAVIIPILRGGIGTIFAPEFCLGDFFGVLPDVRTHYSLRSRNPVFEAPGRKSASSGKSGLQAQKQKARRFEAELLLRIEVSPDHERPFNERDLGSGFGRL
jgi:hypothetical protein